MALFHCSVKRLQRSKGDSASGCAAYRLDLEIVDGYSGVKYDQKGRHSHPITHEFLAPAGFDLEQNPIDFFRNVDAFEKRKDATIGKEFEISLPIELSRKKQKKVARDFAQRFVDEGRVVSIAFHWKNNNPHAHVWVSDRAWTKEKWGLKNKEWDQPAHLLSDRKALADIQNLAYEKAGLDFRVSEKSLKDQGIDRETERKEGKNPNDDVLDHNRFVRELKKTEAEYKQMIIDSAEASNELNKIDDEINLILAEESTVKNDIPEQKPSEISKPVELNQLTAGVDKSDKLDVIESFDDESKLVISKKRKRNTVNDVPAEPETSLEELIIESNKNILNKTFVNFHSTDNIEPV